VAQFLSGEWLSFQPLRPLNGYQLKLLEYLIVKSMLPMRLTA